MVLNAPFLFSYQFLKTIIMIKDNYLYSSVYHNIGEFALDDKCTYIYAHSTEGRSYISNDLITKYNTNVNFVELKEIKSDIIHDETSKKDFHLRDSDSMYNFFSQYKNSIIYIDSSGLNNRICASLLKNAFSCFDRFSLIDLRVIYAEPKTYKVVQFSTEGFFNDLSESIEGIEPLPGFANIIPYGDEDTCYAKQNNKK